MSYGNNEQYPFFNEVKSINDFKAHRRRLQIEWTPRFCWVLIPTVEINTSVKEVSFTFLCFGLYFSWLK